ncbi:PfkB family carbohydrate kinase [Halanaerobium sp. ST460_2HS_T2]|uniref:PfkB family carbohydrate kinase n=1 Tax=Halanaerobium sp. ST460_2HS_T2 TaxID=2183914 RepID=UPI000DF47505|nr:PfkB family carbohydrate kinase [Halanaerobium sp. ST460_2HS_T2]RCW56213.1 fructoselysine 6-kinase [Halanaerobium sp. ST460_2HS_T2]
MQYDIFSVGDNIADYYPEEKKVYAGGGAFNTAVIAKRLGAKAAYYGVFGTDDNAKFLFETLKKEKVAYPVNDIRKGRNALSIIRKEGNKAIVEAVDKGVYKNLKINKNVLEIIKNSKIVHSNIYSYFEDYLPQLHYKTKLSFDFSYLRNKEYIEDIISKVDIAFFSESKDNEDPAAFLDWVSQFEVEAAILTLGDQGVLMKTGDNLIKETSLPVEVIDTLGAGDAFIAAFLTYLAKNEKNYQKALTKGLQTAARYCKVRGGLGVFQPREEEQKIYKNVHE